MLYIHIQGGRKQTKNGKKLMFKIHLKNEFESKLKVVRSVARSLGRAHKPKLDDHRSKRTLNLSLLQTKQRKKRGKKRRKNDKRFEKVDRS